LRGVVYRNRVVTVTGEGISERAFYDFELDDYDECLALTRNNPRRLSPLPFEYDPDYSFGGDIDDPCIDLNPIINYESSIDWRCVERENILDGLAAIIPGHLRTVPHTVVIRVEYSRHVQGRFDGVFTFEAGNIHLLEMEAVAIFE
jgi:hypothetical protein